MADGTSNYGADPLTDLFAAIEPAPDAAMTYFYGHLFAIEPQIRAMFPPAMDAQRACFWQALTRLMTQRHIAGQLAAYLDGLGRAHRKFGVQKEHFDAVRQALTATWQRYAPQAWTDAAAWEELFSQAAALMSAAAERDAEQAPPRRTSSATTAPCSDRPATSGDPPHRIAPQEAAVLVLVLVLVLRGSRTAAITCWRLSRTPAAKSWSNRSAPSASRI